MNDKIKDLLAKAYKTDSIAKTKWRVENREQLREQRKKELKELMTNNKQQTEINAVEYLDKVNQFAKKNNTDKPRQQTAVEWLFDNVYMAHSELSEKLKQAKEMEKEQIIDAFLNGDNTGCASEQNIKDFAEQYYNETYGEVTNNKL